MEPLQTPLAQTKAPLVAGGCSHYVPLGHTQMAAVPYHVDPLLLGLSSRPGTRDPPTWAGGQVYVPGGSTGIMHRSNRPTRWPPAVAGGRVSGGVARDRIWRERHPRRFASVEELRSTRSSTTTAAGFDMGD